MRDEVVHLVESDFARLQIAPGIRRVLLEFVPRDVGKRNCTKRAQRLAYDAAEVGVGADHDRDRSCKALVVERRRGRRPLVQALEELPAGEPRVVGDAHDTGDDADYSHDCVALEEALGHFAARVLDAEVASEHREHPDAHNDTHEPPLHHAEAFTRGLGEHAPYEKRNEAHALAHAADHPQLVHCARLIGEDDWHAHRANDRAADEEVRDEANAHVTDALHVGWRERCKHQDERPAEEHDQELDLERVLRDDLCR